MRQFEELGDFKPCTQQEFDQVICPNQKVNVYIHKLGLNKVLVRLPQAQKKIHCWRLKTVQVTQYGSEKGTSQKAITEIEFDGEMIFTHISLFNQILCREILEYVDSISSQLRKWCAAPIKNVFLLTERMQQSLGFKHGFAKIQPILYYQKRYFYFQYRRWTGELQSQIQTIQNAQHVKGTSNYSYMFDYVCKKISEQRKKQKQKQQRMLELYRKKKQKKRLQEQQRQRQERQRQERERLRKQLEQLRKKQRQRQKQQEQQRQRLRLEKELEQQQQNKKLKDYELELNNYYKNLDKNKSPDKNKKYDNYNFNNLGANVFDLRIKYLEKIKRKQIP